MTSSCFAPIDEAVEAIRRGEVIVVVDDEDRENEGDLIMAAEHATPERLAFFIRHTSGLVCATVTEEHAERLQLPLMVADNTESQRTAFTVTIDAMAGISTGISAGDRATTIRALADESAEPGWFARPGHVHVLRARAGGVLKRAGHTEAATDLAALAGCAPVGVLAEIVTADGLGMARRPELVRFAERHGLLIITIADLIRHRLEAERLVTRLTDASIPTEWGEFRCIPFRGRLDGETHLALVYGEVGGEQDTLVRVHSECLTGDVFGSRRCDCGDQLQAAMARIAAEGSGVLVYLRGHEGRGIGIANKIAAYRLQDQGFDTVDANLRLGLAVDSREYGIGAQILRELGVSRLRLITNNPAKRCGLSGFGLDVVERVHLPTRSTPENVAYLRAKRDRLGHELPDAALG